MIHEYIFRVKWWFSGEVAEFIEEHINGMVDAFILPVFPSALASIFLGVFVLAILENSVGSVVVSGIFLLVFGFMAIVSIAGSIQYFRYRLGTPVREWIDNEVVRV